MLTTNLSIGWKMTVVCAGMYRSGSTWLFNAVRIMVQRSIGPVGVATEPEEMVGFDNYVVKTHGFGEELYRRADVVLVSHRDLRDVVASCHRMFKMPLTIDTAREALGHYLAWLKYAKYDMRYETMMEDPAKEVERIAQSLGLVVDAPSIAMELSQLSFVLPSKRGHDKTTFLHPNHITNGKHGSWVGLLPTETANNITIEFSDWMKSNGYC